MIECDGVEWNGQELRESGGLGLKGKRQGAVKWPAGPAVVVALLNFPGAGKEQKAKRQGHFESGPSPGSAAEGAWGWEWGGAGEGVGSGDGGETRSSEQS